MRTVLSTDARALQEARRSRAFIGPSPAARRVPLPSPVDDLTPWRDVPSRAYTKERKADRHELVPQILGPLGVGVRASSNWNPPAPKACRRSKCSSSPVAWSPVSSASITRQDDGTRPREGSVDVPSPAPVASSCGAAQLLESAHDRRACRLRPGAPARGSHRGDGVRPGMSNRSASGRRGVDRGVARRREAGRMGERRDLDACVFPRIAGKQAPRRGQPAG